jgi:hypothetical protein
MEQDPHRLRQRYTAALARAEALGNIRLIVDLPPGRDLAPRQWAVVELELQVVSARLQNRLREAARRYLPGTHEPRAARAFNAIIGKIELDMSTAFTFFDTYADVLTQRLPVGLGQLLAGCDVLAWDALNRDHPALAIIQPPIVYCDRGFGASVAREGIPTPGSGRNPLPLIQIPYSRLQEKYNLTSVLHEAGHEAMKRLQLDTEMPAVIRSRLSRAGAPPFVIDRFAMWMSEIGPDFWTFCAAGHAQAAGIKEILALPPSYVFRASPWDPHPMPYLRARLSFEWCRQVWGQGIWDEWDTSWQALYPLAAADRPSRQLARSASTYLPVVSDVLLSYRFTSLNGRRLPDLFNLSLLAPARLDRIAATAPSKQLDLRPLSPAAQLAVFRSIRDRGRISEDTIDRMMTRWLVTLASTSRRLT